MLWLQIRQVSNKASLSYNLRLKAKNADLKLTFIPLVFVLLRMWGAALGVIYIYLPHHARHSFRETEVNAALVLFHVSRLNSVCLFVCSLASLAFSTYGAPKCKPSAHAQQTQLIRVDTPCTF